MRELSFNEWMVYIHEQLNYPKEKLKQYEKSIRPQGSVQNYQPRTIKFGRHGHKPKEQNHPSFGDN